DMGDTHRFSVSDPRFEVVNGQLRLAANANLDGADGGLVSFVITVTDQHGDSAPFAVSLAVSSVGAAPDPVIPAPLPFADDAVIDASMFVTAGLPGLEAGILSDTGFASISRMLALTDDQNLAAASASTDQSLNAGTGPTDDQSPNTVPGPTDDTGTGPTDDQSLNTVPGPTDDAGLNAAAGTTDDPGSNAETQPAGRQSPAGETQDTGPGPASGTAVEQGPPGAAPGLNVGPNTLIVGTGGSDALNGTASDDEISGRGGADILSGNAGDD